MLKVGDHTPNFVATTTDGRTMSARDLRGRWVVIYFFPKAFTPGCKKETMRFRDAYPDIRQLGGEVLGISVDDHRTQCDFAEATGASFPMVGDADFAMSSAFGVVRPWLKLDKRVTFVVDREGVIRGVFQHEFQISRHLDDVLHLLEKLVKAEVDRPGPA